MHRSWRFTTGIDAAFGTSSSAGPKPPDDVLGVGSEFFASGLCSELPESGGVFLTVRSFSAHSWKLRLVAGGTVVSSKEGEPHEHVTAARSIDVVGLRSSTGIE